VSNRDRFDKFTEPARRSLHHAQEEAQRFQHSYIGTEHLLLGLLGTTDSVAIQVLESMGIELQKVRSATEFIVGRSDSSILGEIGLTPRAKKVIELAVDEARQMHHHYIGTEHILLGLIREGEGIAAGVLESLGVTLAKAHHHTHIVLEANKQPQAASDTGANQPDTAQESSSANSASYSYGLISSEKAESTQNPATPPSSHRRVPYDKFTERARKVFSFAQEEAQRFQHNYIGTEHLLLGLVREQDGIAAHILQNLGVELGKARNAIESIIGRGDRIILGEIGLTPRAKKVIELAVEEAHQLKHPYIGTEHLLLGLVREGGGIAIGALESMDVQVLQVRAETLKLIQHAESLKKQEPPPPSPPEAQES